MTEAQPPSRGPETGEPQSSAERPGGADGGELTPSDGSGPVVPAAGHAAGHARKGMFGVHGWGDTSGYGGLELAPFVPKPAQRPYGGPFDDLADDFAAAMATRKIAGPAVQQVTVDRGEITFYVRRENILELCRMLRDDESLRFELCSSVSGVDYGVDVPQRLHVVYHLTSMTHRRRIRLEVSVGVDDAHVPSVVEVYPTADWHEREIWDMFGVIFDGHPGLTRILMPDDWDGYPQRKDYPLGGIPVEFKGAVIPPPDERRSYS